LTGSDGNEHVRVPSIDEPGVVVRGSRSAEQAGAGSSRPDGLLPAHGRDRCAYTGRRGRLRRRRRRRYRDVDETTVSAAGRRITVTLWRRVVSINNKLVADGRPAGTTQQVRHHPHWSFFVVTSDFYRV